MYDQVPHYLLLSETDQGDIGPHGGRWRFVLQQTNGAEQMCVSDCEPGVEGERLQLLTVVRGLEALDQPSRVTLVTTSQYVGRGIRQCLAEWRQTHWQWERFGELAPIKHQDLWRRLDRAMRYHRVVCRTWQFSAAAANEFADWDAPMPKSRSADPWKSSGHRRPFFGRCAEAAKRICDRLSGGAEPQPSLRQSVA